jgi:drug/metabolite transporter (DMT)-like permease
LFFTKQTTGLKNLFLYLISSLIWGSTWLVITFQLGVVDPIVSVVYRFVLAGIMLFVCCIVLKMELSYKPKDHFFFALQGFFLFGINYWLVYLAEVHLKSGLVALLFSLIVFMNIFNGFLFLGKPIRKLVLIGGIVGVLGTFLVFYSDILTFSFTDENSLALVLGLTAVLSASFGNIISARNQINSLPVLQTNAFGMFYGGLAMFAIALFTGAELNFDTSFSYIASLVYLTLFGSIAAFSAYLKLLGNIGPDKSAYVTLVIPVIALILSTIFEDYQWSPHAAVGVVLILGGNTLILQRKKRNSQTADRD